jgi:hypothetical protein
MILRFQQTQQRIHAKSASSVYGVESVGDDDLSVDSSDDDSGEEEEEEGGEGGELYIRDNEEVVGIALLAASRGAARGGTPVAGNDFIGVDIRGADEAVVPVLLPFVTQTQQSAGEQVAGFAAPQQLFTPQPSWAQQLPVQQGMGQLPVQPIVQPSVAVQPKPKRAKKCKRGAFVLE